MQPLDIHSLAQNYQPTQIAQPSAAPASGGKAKPGGLKGFLINNLPSIAGGIGLVGGELLDPFGGGLVTGAAASGLGEGLKEKLLGQSLSPKQIAIQAGETAALGGAGKAFGAAKAGSKAVLGLDSAEQVAKTAGTTGAEAVATNPTPTFGQKITNAIINKGQQTEAKVGAFAPGQKVNGVQLNTAASRKIGQTLTDQGIQGTGAPEQLSNIGKKLDTYNQARTSLMDAHNVPLTSQDKVALTEAINSRLGAEAGGSADNVIKHAQIFGKEALNKEDISGLGQYKTSLDQNAINWSRNPASTEPGQMIAAKAVRGAIKDFVEQKVPGIAEVNSKSTALRTAEGALMNASGKLANLTTGSEGLWSRLLSGETAEKGKSIFGKALQAGGKALGGEAAGTTLPAAENVVAQTATTGAKTAAGGIRSGILGRTVAPVLAKPGKTAGAVAKQIIGRDVGGAIINGPGGNSTAQTPATTPADISALSTASSTTPSADSTSQYPQENMLYDIERDPAHASTYEALYKQLNTSSQSTQQKNEVDNATNALTALEAYTNLIKTGGGAKSGIIGGLENLGVKAKLVQGPTAAAITTANQARIELASQLAKTVTGSGRPPEAVIMAYKESLPSVSDTPATVEAKINFMKTILQARIANSTSGSAANSASASGIDIGNLATQLGAQ